MKMLLQKRLGVLMLSFLLLGCNEEKSITKTTAPEPSETTEKLAYVDHVKWAKDLDSAFALSKEQNKPLIVMVESHGCRWCIKMKETTLNDPKVLKKLDEFIIVKVLRENPADRSRLPEFKHVPIMFFYQANGELFDNLRGYFVADDFLEYLNELN
ncbi:MAG: thioredoxin family protein [Epsilonproteobacteria bacterium]|nr:thioredoxin family protein [Campylobacterota bacterium]